MKDIYNAAYLNRSHYVTSLEEQEAILSALNTRTDVQSERLKRYIMLPDLTRLEGSPVKTIIDKVIDLPSLRKFDIIETSEVISPEIVFDLFNFPKDHPARSASDTYYVDDAHILRPHTSLMWKYYFDIPEVREKLEKHGVVGALSYGKVYRKDEIDWQHSNILHQLDGLFVCRKDIKKIGQSDLENICSEVTHSLLGADVKENFQVDKFPYTDPSIEMNVEWDGRWVEVNGAGIVHPQVLRNLNIDPDIYNGWAFGFGADRLAMLKMRIPDIRILRSDDERVINQLKDIDHIYQPVSKYPSIVRDVSFIVNKKLFNVNSYYEIVREIGDALIEEVALLDQYTDENKFGADKESYTFRITYRHLDRTLTNEEVDVLHKKLEYETVSKFGATIR